MDATIHPMAPHYIPWYLPGPDGSDGLLTFTAILLVAILLMVGNLYLRLHALPERMAHSSNHTQQQAVTVLALLALFTHNNLFWVIALFIAVVRWPDLSTPLNAIADALERREGRRIPPDIDHAPRGFTAPDPDPDGARQGRDA
jgi:hypothetical protein